MTQKIAPADGKLGVLLPGLGAVSTTLIAGVFAARKGVAQPHGSLTQNGTIRLGKRTDNRSPKIKAFDSLTPLDAIVFGGWANFPANTLARPTRRRPKHVADPPRNEINGEWSCRRRLLPGDQAAGSASYCATVSVTVMSPNTTSVWCAISTMDPDV